MPGPDANYEASHTPSSTTSQASRLEIYAETTCQEVGLETNIAEELSFQVSDAALKKTHLFVQQTEVT